MNPTELSWPSVTIYQNNSGDFILPSIEEQGSGLYCETLEGAINFYYGIRFCGCSDRKSAFKEIYEALKYGRLEEDGLCPYDHPRYETDPGMWHFIYYQLDVLNLIEHGTSIGSGWITEKGRALYNDLKILFEQSQIKNPSNDRP